MRARRGDQPRRSGLAALERGQPSVRQGEEAQGGGQPVDRAGQRLGRRVATLEQGVVQREEIEQQRHPGLRRARGMHAVGQHRHIQRRGQRDQRRAHQTLTRRAGQHGAGGGGDRQPLGRARGLGRELQQTPRLAGQAVGQSRGLEIGGERGQARPGRGQIGHPPLQRLPAPGKTVPAAEQSAPGQDVSQRRDRAGFARRHQIAQPVHPVQGEREGARGAGLVPGIPVRPDLERLARQGEGPGQQGLSDRGIGGARLPRGHEKPPRARPAQRQPVRGRTGPLRRRLSPDRRRRRAQPQQRPGVGAKAAGSRGIGHAPPGLRGPSGPGYSRHSARVRRETPRRRPPGPWRPPKRTAGRSRP